METISLYQLAQTLEQNQQWSEALVAYTQYYRENPELGVPSLQAMARIYRQQGKLEAARECLIQLLEQVPEDARTYLELGQLFWQSQQLEHAVNYLQQALRLEPELAQAYYWLGRIFQQAGYDQQAQRYYQQAVHYQPDYVEALNAWGVVCLVQNELETALEVLSKAVSLNPENPIYHKHYGLALFWSGQETLAIQHLDTAIRQEPLLAEFYLNMGTYFIRERQMLSASVFLKLALRGRGVRRSLLFSLLAECAERESDTEQALYFYRKACESQPEDWSLEVRAATLLPWIYENEEAVGLWRERYQRNLTFLCQRLPHWSEVRRYPISHYTQNFLLAYQGFDNRALFELLAGFWRQVLPPAPPLSTVRQPLASQIRIGFVSSHFYRHPVMDCFSALLLALVEEGFEVSCFQVGQPYQDAVTTALQTQVHHYHDLSAESSIERLAEVIHQENLDILVYPEVGMETYTSLLALQRLAPVQCVLPGHPLTTGSPVMDYFISCILFEPESASNHYTEKLVCTRLPLFAVSSPRRPDKLLSRTELGYPENRRVYLVPVTLFKVHPVFDRLLGDLLKADPDAVVVLIQSRYYHWHEKLQQRFQVSLADLSERILFLPWSEQEIFFMRLLQADLVLDCPIFGLGTVAYQALGLGVPILTMPGAFMRGRIVAGLYRQLGMDVCIAQNEADFVRRACELAQNSVLRAQVAQTLLERSPQLFDASAAIQEVCAFFRRFVQESRQSPYISPY